jgi:flagellar protein FliO/FliZ
MTNAGWSSLLWFALIVVAIPFALVLLKRTPLGGGASGAGSMRVVGTLGVAPNQRVVTVEVGTGAERRWLVLGVTAQSISTLHTMLPGPDAERASPLATADGQTFAQVAARLWSRPQREHDSDAR